jgi:hypothetical protein
MTIEYDLNFCDRRLAMARNVSTAEGVIFIIVTLERQLFAMLNLRGSNTPRGARRLHG